MVSFWLGLERGEPRWAGAEGMQAVGLPRALAAALVREKGEGARGPREAMCVSSPSGVAAWHFRDVRCSSFS